MTPVLVYHTDQWVAVHLEDASCIYNKKVPLTKHTLPEAFGASRQLVIQQRYGTRWERMPRSETSPWVRAARKYTDSLQQKQD